MSSRARSREHDVDNFFNLSGAAMNRVRSTSVPRSSGRPLRDVTGNATSPLHIDLDNFEDPQFEDSKYVLTSPRSLEACSHFGIKPLEMLYKPLIDFQEELVPEGYSIRTIYEVYDQHEKERQNKLQLCREERGRIIADDERYGRSYTSPVIGQSAASFRERPVTLTSKSTTRELLNEKERPVSPGSLQRARTAWATSLGHDRVTPQELQHRAEEILKQGQKIKSTTIKAAKPRKNLSKTTNTSSSKTKRAKVLAIKKPTIPRPRKKQEREQKQKEQQSEQKSQHRSQESISDASSVVTSGSGSRSGRPWIKDPLADAQPITDPQLRQKLQGATNSTRLTPRNKSGARNVNRHSAPVMRTQDQKILKLMLEKREQEKNTKDSRDTNRLRWEQERQIEAARRNSVENKRRQSLDEQNLQREARRIETTARRTSEDDHRKRDREETLEVCTRHQSAALQKQLELRKKKKVPTATLR